VDEAVMELAWMLNGDIKRDGRIIHQLCMAFSLSPEDVYREVFSRFQFPDEWMLH
jgi:hypothetical protein